MNLISSATWFGVLTLLGAGMAHASESPFMMQPGDTARDRYTLSLSYALPSAVEFRGAELGDVDTRELRAAYSHAFQVSEDYRWTVGLGVQWLSFDAPEALPVPDHLYGLSIRLGNQWRIDDRWSFQFQIAPGLYSDLEDVDWGDFNAPLLALGGYSFSPNLQGVFGAHVNWRRDLPVIPALGARWRFHPDWTLLLVYPTPRIEYAMNEALTVFLGVELIRSAFRVADDFGSRQGIPELDGEDLSYNDWRVGAGARYRFSRSFTAAVEAGWVIQREFNYDEVDIEADADGALFFKLSLNGSF